MKKIISVLLLLAMVLGCFAGCAPEAATEDAGLNAAKEYLYAIYKDGDKVTSNNYTLVSQVMVEDVTYPITWTTNVSEEIVKITAGENGMALVTINATAEDVNYTLTGTLKNDKGQEASVSFDKIIPAKAQVSGKTIVLAYPKENKFITGSHYLYTGKNKWQLNLTETEADAIALEVIENSDGTVTFKAGDQYLFCDATHVKFVDTEDDYTKFVLEAADTEGGYYIKCAVANYNGSPQYLEVYSGYLTCYGMGTDPSIYVFKLQESTTAAGTISGLEDSSTGGDSTGGDSNSGNSGNTNTGGDKVDTDKTSATLYYAGEKLYVTGTASVYTSSTTGKTKDQMVMSSKKAEAIALTIKTNSDNTISFVAEGKYLSADGTNVKFVSKQDDNTKFVLESAGAEGKYFIKCAVANYNGNPQYLEVYKGYLTCYGMGADASIYTFELKDTSGAKGKITAAGSSSSGNTSGGNTSGGSSSGGNTSGGNTSGGTTTDTTKTSATLYYIADGLYVTGTEYIYNGKTTKTELVLSDKKADAIALTIKTNSDNTISFTAEGKYLFCDGTHVKFEASQSDYTKFVLESAGTNKYYIKCAVANYNGNAQYLEVYSGYLTCYSMYDTSDKNLYTFELKDTSGANGKITAASTSGGNTSGGNTSGGNTSGGNTGSGTADVDGKLAASLNMEGPANATSHTSTQTVYAANGITYTNDKASSQTANIAPPDFSARAYQGSTIKVEYTGMIAIVFNLDSHQSGKYLEGFDGMVVDGATITREGSTVTITFAKATNVFQSANLLKQVRIKSIDVYTAN